MPDSRTFALVRHGGTDLQRARRLNGDPSVPVAPHRRRAAPRWRALRDEIADMPIDLGVHTRFPRTRQTIDLLLAGRDVPRRRSARTWTTCCSGSSRARRSTTTGASGARTARRTRGRAAARAASTCCARYARGFERLLAVAPRTPLVVTHDIPIRFLANAIAGEDPLDGPVQAVANASLMTVARGLRRGVEAMKRRPARV